MHETSIQNINAFVEEVGPMTRAFIGIRLDAKGKCEIVAVGNAMELSFMEKSLDGMVQKALDGRIPIPHG